MRCGLILQLAGFRIDGEGSETPCTVDLQTMERYMNNLPSHLVEIAPEHLDKISGGFSFLVLAAIALAGCVGAGSKQKATSGGATTRPL